MSDDDPKEKPVPATARMTTRAEVPGGPPQWLERLFEEHHERVFRAAYRITGNAMDAEDVLQTVFLRLLRRDGGAPLTGSPGSYLHLAAVNGALDLVRARAAARTTPLEGVEGVLAAGAGSAPDRAQEGREIKEAVRNALAELSPRTAEIFALRYFEQYGNREIAPADRCDTVVGVAARVCAARVPSRAQPVPEPSPCICPASGNP